jgi:hypothetical protein
MYFTQFYNKIEQTAAGCTILEQAVCFNHLVQRREDGVILIDRVESDSKSMEEAISFIKQQRTNEAIQQQIQQDLYEDISVSKIVNIIRKHHDNVKITDTLIESYVDLASSKLFTSDLVVQDIRKFNKLDKLIENRIDYKLNDGTTVVISDATQQKINNIFGKHQDVIEYMRENQDNFLNVLNQIEE